MSESNDPTRDIKPVTPAQSDSSVPPILDPDATLDTSGNASPAPSGGSGASRAPIDAKFMGPYRLVRKLGEGGMGQVWLAEQTAPVRRQVALKLIKVGMYDDDVLKRFQSERQSLAIMDHPAIAKVFDAGSTPDGQPYFVMEYVPGVPITEYCDQKRLRIPNRLELFIKVCERVQHAHQKAIIHRDLKPANILVVEVDGKPVPRIIDFGLAKATTPQIAGEAMFTQVGSFVGTPGYMSPEQADASVQDIDTRTDVYSLGVVLYVLLSGSLPFDPKKWQKQPLHEVLRQLREDEPPRPSTKIGMEKESSAASAPVRDVQPKQLVSLLHGDLDWITMKALEKDRARRYGTPTELADDITRYLGNEPVLARPASAGYRLQKYVRRHRMGVSVAAVIAILVGGFAVTEAVNVRRITEERDRMDRVAIFMRDMFAAADPNVAHRNDVTARQVLDAAAKNLDSEMYADPKFQALMKLYLGQVFIGIGDFKKAQALLESAMKISQQANGPNDPVTVESTGGLAWCLAQQGLVEEAAPLVQRILDTQRRTLEATDPMFLTTLSEMSYILRGQGKYDESEKLAREAMEIARRKLGPEADATLQSTTSLAAALQMQGKYPESEKLLRGVILIEQRRYGTDSSATLGTMDELSQDLHKEGRYAENEELLYQILEIKTRVFGAEHPGALGTRITLMRTLRHEGKFSDAEKIARDTVAIEQRVNGSNHRETAYATSTLGLILSSEGKYVEAKPLMQQVVQIATKNSAAADITLAWYNSACAAALGGEKDEALQLLQHAIDAGLPPTDHPEKDQDMRSLWGNPRFQTMMLALHNGHPPHS